MDRLDSDQSLGPDVPGVAPAVAAAVAGSQWVPPVIIGVAGGGASGKTTVCNMILSRIDLTQQPDHTKVAMIKMEDFTRELTDAQRLEVDAGTYNFDHPTAIDFDLLERTLLELIAGHEVAMPEWCFAEHRRKRTGVTLARPDIIILEGTLVLYKKRVRDVCNLRVFVDVDSDLRFARQVVRDTEERYKKKIDVVINDYMQHVKPSFEEFILPSKKFADMIIPRGEDNVIAIGLLAKHIEEILSERSGLVRTGLTRRRRRSLNGSETMIASVVDNVGAKSPAKGVTVIS